MIVLFRLFNFIISFDCFLSFELCLFVLIAVISRSCLSVNLLNETSHKCEGFITFLF